jgi:hypothetical protein
VNDAAEEERNEKYESRQRKKKAPVKECSREEYEEKINDIQKKVYVPKKKKEISKRPDQWEGRKQSQCEKESSFWTMEKS